MLAEVLLLKPYPAPQSVLSVPFQTSRGCVALHLFTWGVAVSQGSAGWNVPVKWGSSFLALINAISASSSFLLLTWGIERADHHSLTPYPAFFPPSSPGSPVHLCFIRGMQVPKGQGPCQHTDHHSISVPRHAGIQMSLVKRVNS